MRLFKHFAVGVILFICGYITSYFYTANKWEQIGRVTNGNKIYIDPTSIQIINAELRSASILYNFVIQPVYEGKTIGSSIVINETDCLLKSFKRTGQINFSGADASGSIVSTSSLPNESYIPDDKSIGKSIVNAVCN